MKLKSLQCNDSLQDIEYDENGQPKGYSVEDVFDQLDQKLITHYGEDTREMVNKSRSEWNKKYPWKFKPL